MLSLLLTSKWCPERASAANFSHQPLTSHHLVILTFRMISFFYLYHRQCACVPEIINCLLLACCKKRIVLRKRCGYTYTSKELHCAICGYTYIHTYIHTYIPMRRQRITITCLAFQLGNYIVRFAMSWMSSYIQCKLQYTPLI